MQPPRSQGHPHWKAHFQRLEARIGRPKALVTIARKLWVAVWHILTKAEADRFADEENVAASFFALAYKMGVKNLLEGVSARPFTRQQLDRLGLGRELTHLP